MKKRDYENGVWRTIGGRRVFIRKGQSLSDAMRESGKFKKKDEEKNEAEKYYSKLSQYQAREDLDMRKTWLDDNVYDESKRKEYEDFYKQGEEYYNKKYEKHIVPEAYKDSMITSRNDKNKKILSGNKGLSQKEMDDMSPYNGGKLYSNFTDEEKQLAQELHLRSMAMSAWTYGGDLHTDKDVNSAPGNEKYYNKPYINEFYDTLGKERTEEILRQQKEHFDRGAVEKNVYTDSEGLTYNRFIEPVHSRNSRILENVGKTNLKERYKGTYQYLQNTTNMSGAEILELLKKIDEDKK